MRRFVAMLLCCLLIFQAGTGVLAAEGTERGAAETSAARDTALEVPDKAADDVWDGTTNFTDTIDYIGGKHYIRYAAQLAYVADEIAGGDTTMAAADYILAAHLDLNNLPWTPIGTQDNPFTGTMTNEDPENNLIDNLSVSESEYAGLFGYTEGAEISGITIRGDVEFAENRLDSVGAIVGYAGDGLTLTDCRVTGAVRFSVDDALQNGGGLVGYAEGGELTMEGCAIGGGVTMDTAAGGGTSFGGLVGVVQTGGLTVEDCAIYGGVRLTAGDDLSLVGGLAGDVNGAPGDCVITDSAIYGGVYLEARNYISYAGGLLGSTQEIDRLVVEACGITGGVYFTGVEDYVMDAGGLIGRGANDISVADCTIDGDVAFTAGDYIVAAGGVAGQLTGADPAAETAVSAAIDSGVSFTSGHYISDSGGLVGTVDSTDRFAVTGGGIGGDVSVEAELYIARTGGLVGIADGADETVIRDVALTGDVEFAADREYIFYTGGLVGTVEDGGAALRVTGGASGGSVSFEAETQIDNCGGLVGGAEGALEISGRELSRVSVTAGGNLYNIGGLAGNVEDSTTITDSGLTGGLELSAEREPGAGQMGNIGGLIGYAASYDEPLSIRDAYVAGGLTLTLGAESRGVERVGGLVGSVEELSTGSIQGSFSAGALVIDQPAVDDEPAEVSYVGGLVGGADNSHSAARAILNCYSTMDIDLTGVDAGDCVGGLVGGVDDYGGTATIEKSYYAGDIAVRFGQAGGAGLILGSADAFPDTSVDFADVYYDADIAADAADSGIGALTAAYRSAAGEGLTEPEGLKTWQMTRENGAYYMDGLDFTSIWQEAVNGPDTAIGRYPQLREIAGAHAQVSLASVATDAYYYVTYDGDGGTLVGTITEGDLENDYGRATDRYWSPHGTAVNLPEAEKSGASNQNRWRDASGTVHTGSLPALARDYDLTAYWGGGTVTPDPDRYTVTFYYNHEEAPADIYTTQTVNAGATATEPAVPEDIVLGVDEDNYLHWLEFDGWYTEPECENQYEFDSAVRGDLSLYAGWVREMELQGDGPQIDLENHFAYMVGYEEADGTFKVKPEDNITRAETATLFFRLLTDESRETYWSQINPFADVAAGDWYNNAISTAYLAELVNGHSVTEFAPEDDITRAEFAALAARFSGTDSYTGRTMFSDVPEDEWYWEEVHIAYTEGWIQGDGDGAFRPNDPITRAEVATLVNRMRGGLPENMDDLLDDMLVWPDNPAPGEPGSDWYYYDIQEATNSHYSEPKLDENGDKTGYETWTGLRENRNWTVLQREDATPQMLYTGETWNPRSPDYIPPEA